MADGHRLRRGDEPGPCASGIYAEKPWYECCCLKCTSKRQGQGRADAACGRHLTGRALCIALNALVGFTNRGLSAEVAGLLATSYAASQDRVRAFERVGPDPTVGALILSKSLHRTGSLSSAHLRVEGERQSPYGQA
jgi:hypothetical protein